MDGIGGGEFLPPLPFNFATSLDFIKISPVYDMNVGIIRNRIYIYIVLVGHDKLPAGCLNLVCYYYNMFINELINLQLSIL